ncbi:MAG: hypothetical protein GY859_22350 [Desulfobacterales bacterium]|nr:hypothetical protein [Desulfobacterales bacterium]
MKDRILKAEKILLEFRDSSSLPVLVKTRDGSCVLKWKGGGDGCIASIIDWIGLRLARLIGVETPRSALIEVGVDLRDQTNDAEIRDLIDASQGLNPGSRYLADAAPYQEELHGATARACKEKIFFYDLLMLNIDRTDVNPNMLVMENQLYCIDFSASMALRDCITGSACNEEPLLKRVKRHPFYTESPRAAFTPDKNFYTRLQNIIEETPTEWLQCEPSERLDLKQKIFDNIAILFENIPSIIGRRLEILAKLPLTTVEEDRKKSLNNRREAEARFLRA